MVLIKRVRSTEKSVIPAVQADSASPLNYPQPLLFQPGSLQASYC